MSLTDIFKLPPELRLLLVNNGINLIAAILILTIGWLIATLLGRWVRIGLSRIPHFDPTLRPLIASAIRYGIIAVTLIAVLGRFGVETSSLIAVVGAAGIAVGLALQSTLSNVASGVMLLLIRPFQVGDKIQAGGIVGTVREIELFRTVIITDDLLFTSIPNSTIFASNIVNETRESRRRFGIPIMLDHSTDIGEAQKMILGLMTSNPKVLQLPAPTVPITSIDQNGVTLTAYGYTLNRDSGPVKDATQIEMFRRVSEDERFRFPRQVVSLRGGPLTVQQAEPPKPS